MIWTYGFDLDPVRWQIVILGAGACVATSAFFGLCCTFAFCFWCAFAFDFDFDFGFGCDFGFGPFRASAAFALFFAAALAG